MAGKIDFKTNNPKMACSGSRESGFPDFGSGCRPNWWHQVPENFGVLRELCGRSVALNLSEQEADRLFLWVATEMSEHLHFF